MLVDLVLLVGEFVEDGIAVLVVIDKKAVVQNIRVVEQ